MRERERVCCTLHKTSKEHCWVEETTDEAAKRVVVGSWASQSLCIEDNSIAVDQHHHLLFQEGRRNSSQLSESSQTAKEAASKTYQTLGRSFSWPKPIWFCVWQQNKTKPGLAAATAQWNKLRKIPLIYIPFFFLHLLLLLFSQDKTPCVKQTLPGFLWPRKKTESLPHLPQSWLPRLPWWWWQWTTNKNICSTVAKPIQKLLPAAFRRVVYTDATSSSISYHGS